MWKDMIFLQKLNYNHLNWGEIDFYESTVDILNI